MHLLTPDKIDKYRNSAGGTEYVLRYPVIPKAVTPSSYAFSYIGPGLLLSSMSMSVFDK